MEIKTFLAMSLLSLTRVPEGCHRVWPSESGSVVTVIAYAGRAEVLAVIEQHTDALTVVDAANGLFGVSTCRYR